MKITSWNVEWLDHAWGVIEGRYTPKGRASVGPAYPTLDDARKKVAAVEAEVARIDPDVLFLCEGVKGPDAMTRFAAAHLAGWRLVTRPDGADYDIAGTQWLWFLVRNSLAPGLAPELMPVPVWRHFVAEANPDYGEAKGRWGAVRPILRTFGTMKDVPVSTRKPHFFTRHPQTLIMTVDGQRMELVGLHLKSKFVNETPRKRAVGESFDSYAADPKVARYLARAHEARVKLASEAGIVRDYIDQRFRQEEAPAIIVLGDLNDGPGKEVMEREYLLHDMISNLQGDVFLARNFLNHSLFDTEQSLRWTIAYADPMEPARPPGQLIDHILFTQSLTRSGRTPLWVPPKSGMVEHIAHDEVGGTFGKDCASDHRAVSLTLAPRPVA